MNISSKSESTRTAAAVLDSMVLLSSLLTAVGVRYNVAERMAGRDPSDQEPADIAFAHIIEAREELNDLIMRLNASSMYAVSHEEERLSASVRRFNDLLIVSQVARLLHAIHQRLLSLYPAVSETILEEARSLTVYSRGLLDVDDSRFEQEIEPFLVRALDLSAALEHELLG